MSVSRLAPASPRWVRPECRHSCRSQPVPAAPAAAGDEHRAAGAAARQPGRRPRAAGVPVDRLQREVLPRPAAPAPGGGTLGLHRRPAPGARRPGRSRSPVPRRPRRGPPPPAAGPPRAVRRASRRRCRSRGRCSGWRASRGRRRRPLGRSAPSRPGAGRRRTPLPPCPRKPPEANEHKRKRPTPGSHGGSCLASIGRSDGGCGARYAVCHVHTPARQPGRGIHLSFS